jgi:UDP-glucose 4-epimerase
MSKILVTGGAGFIGSHIIGRLLQEGHEVVALDNFDPYYDPEIKRRNVALYLDHSNFTFVMGSILDPVTVESLISDGIEYIYHEAAQAGVRASVENPFKPHEINGTGILHLLESAVKHDVKKFISASSSSVYGTVVRLPFDEDHPNIPVSPYGATKVLAEHYARVYQEIYGMPTISLRYFTVFGPRMRPDLAINIFTHLALKNETITIFGDGEKTRDFTYITNIVDGNMKVMHKGTGHYNMGSGKRVSIRELTEKILAITDSSSDLVFEDAVKGDAIHTWADITKAQKELDYEVTVNLDKGLENYIDWVKETEFS